MAAVREIIGNVFRVGADIDVNLLGFFFGSCTCVVDWNVDCVWFEMVPLKWFAWWPMCCG